MKGFMFFDLSEKKSRDHNDNTGNVLQGHPVTQDQESKHCHKNGDQVDIGIRPVDAKMTNAESKQNKSQR